MSQKFIYLNAFGSCCVFFIYMQNKKLLSNSYNPINTLIEYAPIYGLPKKQQIVT